MMRCRDLEEAERSSSTAVKPVAPARRPKRKLDCSVVSVEGENETTVKRKCSIVSDNLCARLLRRLRRTPRMSNVHSSTRPSLESTRNETHQECLRSRLVLLRRLRPLDKSSKSPVDREAIAPRPAQRRRRRRRRLTGSRAFSRRPHAHVPHAAQRARRARTHRS